MIPNIKSVVPTSNSSLEMIVKVNIFLTDVNNFADFNKVYAKYFSEHKPVRSCVAVAALPSGADLYRLKLLPLKMNKKYSSG